MQPTQQSIVKSLYRNKLSHTIRQLSSHSRALKSRQISSKLLKDAGFRRSLYIVSYAALLNEVDTFRWMEKALALGKRVCLPRVTSRGGLELIKIDNLKSDLVIGSFGILEPKRTLPRVGVDRINLVICPGLGFDRKGNRLGRGAGYYDRFLPLCQDAEFVGICFREQILKRIPRNRDDVRMHRVITD